MFPEENTEKHSYIHEYSEMFSMEYNSLVMRRFT
jgi:hypothetical protein